MVANIVDIHLAIYANGMFMFVFNKTRLWTYWINWIQFHILSVFCFKIRFRVFLSWSPRSPKWLVSLTISFLNILCKSNFPHSAVSSITFLTLMTFPKEQLQWSSFFSYFVSLRCQYSPRHFATKTPHLYSSFERWHRPSFTTTQDNTQGTVLQCK